MASADQPPIEKRRVLKAKPRPDIDRRDLRDAINARYENTLRYLGK